MRAALPADAQHGEVVRKPLPPALVEKRDVEWYVVVVEIVPHAAYDKWFPGRGR